MRPALILLFAPACVFINDEENYWRTQNIDTDSNCESQLWYADKDGDGYGDPDESTQACEAPAATVDNAEDCDDTDSAVNPETVWYDDLDGDGYGGDSSVTGCEQPAGTTLEDGDCNDNDVLVSPGVEEDCLTGHDDNCDGVINQEDALNCVAAYEDADGDSYGGGDSICICTVGDGYSNNGADCDDGAPEVNPDATEVCNDGIDNDCDGSSGACAPSGTVGSDEASTTYLGEANKDSAGYSVAAGSDIDDDGLPDAFIGAPNNDNGGTSSGVLYGVMGTREGNVGLGGADLVAVGPSGSRAGWALAGGGDVDGDGYDDVLVGAPRDATEAANAGGAYLVYGPATGNHDLADIAVLLSGEASQQAGYTVGLGGDLSGDSDSDVVVGAYKHAENGTNSGAVYVANGPVTAGYLADATTTIIGTEAGARLGFTVSVVGDLDGDGVSDLAVSADRADGEDDEDVGKVYVFYGPLPYDITEADADSVRMGDGASAYAGRSIAGAGDIQGDGLDDLLIGAPGTNLGADSQGAAYVVPGPVADVAGLAGAGIQMVGEAGDDQAGTSVAGDFDFDGDGNVDVAVGARYSDAGGSDGGSVYTVYGPLSGVVSLSAASYIITGTADDGLGASLAGFGDAEADGYDEILIGSPGADGAESGAGAAVLFRGGGL